MKHTPERKIKKGWMVVWSVTAVLIILAASGFFLFQFYAGKIQYSDGKLELVNSVEPEPEDGTVPDSGQEEILQLEEQLKQNMENQQTPISDGEVTNILLIGTDTRVPGQRSRSDAMVLVSINDRTDTIVATSLLRDIYVQIPGCGANRLNAAYAYGGADLLMQTIRQNFKIEVDKYAAVDFFAFIDAVDAIGGIDLEITQEELSVANRYIREINRIQGLDSEDGVFTQPGLVHMTGKQALGYSRIRYVGNADFGRTERQRKVLGQLFQQVQSASLIEMNRLLEQLLPQVTTNLTRGELFSLMLRMPIYGNYRQEQWSVPMEGAYEYVTIRGMSVLGIDFDACIEEMHRRIYGIDS